MGERRELLRSPTFLGGRIAHQRLRSSTLCIVKNLSEHGAKVVFSGPATIPDVFDLTIDKTGLCRRSRIVWCNATEAGVSFWDIDARALDVPETTNANTAPEVDRLGHSSTVAQPRSPCPDPVVSLDLYRERVRGPRIPVP